MIKLYYSPNSCSMSVNIALELAGAEYEIIKADKEDTNFAKIAPQGQVPVIQIEGEDTGMNQGSALLLYIAQKFPDANLAGDGSLEQNYELNRALSFVSTDFHLSHMPAFYPQRFTTTDDEKFIADIKEAALVRLITVLGYFEKMLEGKTYLVGDKITIADAYAFTVSRWYNFASPTPINKEQFPNIIKYQELISKNPSVEKVLALHNPA